MPSFCLRSCNDCNTTVNFENRAKRSLKVKFSWNFLEALLKHAWYFQETLSKSLETVLKVPQNYLESPWIALEIYLKHLRIPWNFFEHFLKTSYPWKFYEILLKLPWNTISILLKCQCSIHDFISFLAAKQQLYILWSDWLTGRHFLTLLSN